jgi:hypothetical protein
MGFLARQGRVSEPILRTAVVYGSVLASFVVERFSLERLVALTWEDERSSVTATPAAVLCASQRVALRT